MPKAKLRTQNCALHFPFQKTFRKTLALTLFLAFPRSHTTWTQLWWLLIDFLKWLTSLLAKRLLMLVMSPTYSLRRFFTFIVGTLLSQFESRCEVHYPFLNGLWKCFDTSLNFSSAYPPPNRWANRSGQSFSWEYDTLLCRRKAKVMEPIPFSS